MGKNVLSQGSGTLPAPTAPSVLPRQAMQQCLSRTQAAVVLATILLCLQVEGQEASPASSSLALKHWPSLGVFFVHPNGRGTGGALQEHQIRHTGTPRDALGSPTARGDCTQCIHNENPQSPPWRSQSYMESLRLTWIPQTHKIYRRILMLTTRGGAGVVRSLHNGKHTHSWSLTDNLRASHSD